MDPELEQFLAELDASWRARGLSPQEVARRHAQAVREIGDERRRLVQRGITGEATRRAIAWYRDMSRGRELRLRLSLPTLAMASGPVRATESSQRGTDTLIPRVLAALSPATLALPQITAALESQLHLLRGDRAGRAVTGAGLAACYFAEGLRTAIESELQGRELDAVLRGLEDALSDGDVIPLALVVGTAWGAFDQVRGTVAFLDWLSRLSLDQIETMRLAAIAIVTALTRVAPQYRQLAFEAGAFVGSHISAEIKETFTSAPPNWLPDWLRPSWRAIALGHLMSPLVLAIIGAVYSAAGGPTVMTALARSGQGVVLRFAQLLRRIMPDPHVRQLQKLGHILEDLLPPVPGAAAAERRAAQMAGREGVPNVAPSGQHPPRLNDRGVGGVARGLEESRSARPPIVQAQPNEPPPVAPRASHRERPQGPRHPSHSSIIDRLGDRLTEAERAALALLDQDWVERAAARVTASEVHTYRTGNNSAKGGVVSRLQGYIQELFVPTLREFRDAMQSARGLALRLRDRFPGLGEVRGPLPAIDQAGELTDGLIVAVESRTNGRRRLHIFSAFEAKSRWNFGDLWRNPDSDDFFNFGQLEQSMARLDTGPIRVDGHLYQQDDVIFHPTPGAGRRWYVLAPYDIRAERGFANAVDTMRRQGRDAVLAKTPLRFATLRAIAEAILSQLAER